MQNYRWVSVPIFGLLAAVEWKGRVTKEKNYFMHLLTWEAFCHPYLSEPIQWSQWDRVTEQQN